MSLKVLIADPDFRFARQAGDYLESHAHLVSYQCDTDHIAPTAANFAADLVILAAEIAETGVLEQIMELPNRPAVLLTEFMDRYDRAWRMWQVGGDDILIKPVFTTQELHASVVAALQNASAGTRQIAQVPAAMSA